VWVRLEGTLHDPSWQSEEMSLEDIVLAYLARRPVQAADAPAAIGGVR
jgi:hypothetical protein